MDELPEQLKRIVGSDDLGGSISVEYGIGVEKKAWLGNTPSAVEIELMKKLLDPKNILNSGKVIGEVVALE